MSLGGINRGLEVRHLTQIGSGTTENESLFVTKLSEMDPRISMRWLSIKDSILAIDNVFASGTTLDPGGRIVVADDPALGLSPRAKLEILGAVLLALFLVAVRGDSAAALGAPGPVRPGVPPRGPAPRDRKPPFYIGATGLDFSAATASFPLLW